MLTEHCALSRSFPTSPSSVCAFSQYAHSKSGRKIVNMMFDNRSLARSVSFARIDSGLNQKLVLASIRHPFPNHSASMQYSSPITLWWPICNACP